MLVAGGGRKFIFKWFVEMIWPCYTILSSSAVTCKVRLKYFSCNQTPCKVSSDSSGRNLASKFDMEFGYENQYENQYENKSQNQYKKEY